MAEAGFDGSAVAFINGMLDQSDIRVTFNDFRGAIRGTVINDY
jgi:hypothetical protein